MFLLIKLADLLCGFGVTHLNVGYKAVTRRSNLPFMYVCRCTSIYVFVYTYVQIYILRGCENFLNLFQKQNSAVSDLLEFLHDEAIYTLMDPLNFERYLENESCHFFYAVIHF